MEVKGILEKIRQPKEEKKECFWALEIGFGLVKSSIWAVEEGLVKVLCLGEVKYWQEETELLEAIDASLSSAAEKLEAHENFLEPNKTVLGLSSDWVKANKIVPEKAKLLKKISQELELELVGFVVTEEAVIYQLKSAEGIPPSAILVYLERQRLGVSLVNLGRVVGSEKVSRSGDLNADLVEGLSRIDTEGVLPARIIIYGLDEGLEEARQKIANFSWRESELNFLHLPKTEALESDFDIRAVALAGGREVAGAVGVKKAEPIPAKELPVKTLVQEEAMVMGFVKDKDVAEESLKQVAREPKAKLLSLSIFKVNRWFKKINLSFLPRLVKKLMSFLPKKLPAVGVLVVAFLLIIGGILAILLWLWPHAEITLFIQPRVFEKEFVIKLDPDLKAIDKENLAMPAGEIVATLEGKKTKTSTGSKVVGDQAKGEVTIYNDTAQKKTFDAGTLIVSSSGIKFSLDEEATVASKSGTAADSEPGKTVVSVTAEEIGTEANLVDGTEFSVTNYSKSDYVAKNESALTGGTSREVQVVSNQDRDDLLADLTAELESKAEGELSNELEPDQKLVEESLSNQVVNQTFDKEVEEEGEEVTLTLKLKASGLSFKEAEFKNLIEEEVKAAVPEGFEYKPDEDEVEFKLNKMTDEGAALFAAYFKTKLIPLYNLEEIKSNLTGKHVVVGKAYLDNLSHVGSFDAKITPNLAGRLAFFPRLSKNIKIKIEVE